MSFRRIPKANIKAAIQECIESLDVKETKQIAHKYDMDYRTLQSYCHDMNGEIDEMLKKNTFLKRIQKVIFRIIMK